LLHAVICRAGIAALVNRIDKPRLTVAVDGSVYRFHPHFHQLMTVMTSSLIQPGKEVSTELMSILLLFVFLFASGKDIAGNLIL